MSSYPNVLPRIGTRTILRRLLPADLATFQSYRTDPEVGKYQGWQAQSDDQAAEFIREMQIAAPFQPGQWLQLAIAELESNALIGDIGLFLAADALSAEIGFSLSTNAQGRGLATEAVRAAIALVFECTEVRQIIGTTDARNAPSIKLLERVGMHRIDTATAMFRGAPCVEYTYAVIRIPTAS